jgi:hypothetical protein
MSDKVWIYTLAAISSIYMSSCKTPSVEKRLHNLLKNDSIVSNVLKDGKYQAQILYTHVDLRDTTFVSYPILLNDNYFYPASTVKMPIAFLTLHYLNQQQRLGNDLRMTDDLLQTANRSEQTNAFSDSTTANGKPNIARYIEKIFAVSDNDAYNRLYEFLGSDYINTTLHDEVGIFTNSVICHRVAVTGYTAETNRYTTDWKMYRNDNVVAQKKSTEPSKNWVHKMPKALKGHGYLDAKDSLVLQPFDFTKKNYYSVPDLESTLKRVIFPQKFPPNQRFDLKDDDYLFLKNCLSKMPPSYSFYKNDKEFYDTYVKFLYYGSEATATIHPDLTIYNKVGNAYGYLIDCAYFENKKLGIGYFLTAVIYVNNDEIYNDSKYEYDEIGYPYMKRLGQIFYDHECAMRNSNTRK